MASPSKAVVLQPARSDKEAMSNSAVSTFNSVASVCLLARDSAAAGGNGQGVCQSRRHVAVR